MKTNSTASQKGSVLVVSLLTITIMTLICATSLLMTSQNNNAGMQAASWQKALTGAESGIDAAVRALNDNGQTGAWTNWVQMSQSGTTLPTIEPTPSPTPTPTGAPNSTHYNLLPSSKLSLTMAGEGDRTATVSAWVTVDTGGMLATNDVNGQQWYRIRSTGRANISGPVRVSNNRLDNDLRNTIALRFNRKTGSSTNLGPTRTLEVIMQPLAQVTTQPGWPRAVTLKSWISMSGGSSVIDSYKSSDSSMSTGGQYDATKLHQPPNYYGGHADVGTNDTAGKSDLRSTYVYGSVSYSGATAKNTKNVQGTISGPFAVAIPTPTPPTWTAPAGNTFTGGGSSPPNAGVFNAGTGGSPTYYQVNGDLTISNSGLPLHIVHKDNSTSPLNAIYINVTGKLTTSGSGYIQQDSNVHVYWYVGGDITLSGGSYQNLNGFAANNTIVGYGTSNKLTISGGSDFIGTFNTPGYDVTISGGGSLCGALIANNLTISGGSGFHYDEALSGGSSMAIANFAYASWFEDNSDPKRSIIY